MALLVASLSALLYIRKIGINCWIGDKKTHFLRHRFVNELTPFSRKFVQTVLYLRRKGGTAMMKLDFRFKIEAKAATVATLVNVAIWLIGKHLGWF
jgi:hypothetical protein